MKRLILFGIIIVVLLCDSCTPTMLIPEPWFLSDTETEVLVNCYHYPDKLHREFVDYIVGVNDTLSCPDESTFVLAGGFDIEEGFKYDVKVLDNSTVYVFDFVPCINNQTTQLGMPISAAELYDTIMSQRPELIGTHVLKIDDHEIHDIRKIAYNNHHSSIEFYVDLEGREAK